MNCPRCNGKRARCHDSRDSSQDGKTRRRNYECRLCKQRFTTLEVIVRMLHNTTGKAGPPKGPQLKTIMNEQFRQEALRKITDALDIT